MAKTHSISDLSKNIAAAKRFKWKDAKTVSFSLESAREGGLGLYTIRMLHEEGIPAKRNAAGSPFQGHVAILVPAQFEKRAEKLVL